ncbi:MAG: glycosyltransferase family 2 protein [Chloroflexota bacterium]|nr:glycosyltransferase family 2 protein [Chloroflexota bacterium]
MIDLSIVIVSWNVRDLLRRCLQSIAASSDFAPRGMEVIVVDSGSTDGSVGMLREEFSWVQLIANEENVGFTKGNNQGLRISGGRYVLLLNPDTEVVGDTLSTMVDYMDEHPQVGALGPQLRYPDGAIQSSRRRFPTLATAFLESTVLQQWLPHNRVLDRYYANDQPDDLVQEVDWVVGACILLRREAIEEVGLLDEGFFMYSEELDWCRRAKTRGWKVVYLPAARVIHLGARSSRQVRTFQQIQFQRSKIRYFRKHHGRLVGAVLRAFILLTYVYQLLEEGGKWMVGHKRPLRMRRIRTYRQVLRAGLRLR